MIAFQSNLVLLGKKISNSQTVLSFSQTNKEIMKVCKWFLMANERKKPIFENLKCQSCEDVFTDLFQDFISFVKENEIFYSGYFHFPKENNQDRTSKMALQKYQIFIKNFGHR